MWTLSYESPAPLLESLSIATRAQAVHPESLGYNLPQLFWEHTPNLKRLTLWHYIIRRGPRTDLKT